MLDIAELATTGATTVVAAMATTAWEGTRDAVVRLFRRGGTTEQETVEGQLVSHDGLVRRTEDADRARQALLPVWGLQLESFLNQHPEAADDLRVLIARARDALQEAGQPSVVQHITASAPGATAAGAANGNVYVTTNNFGGPAGANAPDAGEPPEGDA